MAKTNRKYIPPTKFVTTIYTMTFALKCFRFVGLASRSNRITFEWPGWLRCCDIGMGQKDGVVVMVRPLLLHAESTGSLEDICKVLATIFSL